MKIVIGNDHSAVELREVISAHLREKGIEVEEVGTFSTESSNYPEWGEKVARKVVAKEADLGIAICGTGVGISIAANKVKGIRACVCSEPYSARMSRQHNNANVLAMGGRVTGFGPAGEIVRAWVETEFEGGRHERRVNKIMALEQN